MSMENDELFGRDNKYYMEAVTDAADICEPLSRAYINGYEEQSKQQAFNKKKKNYTNSYERDREFFPERSIPNIINLQKIIQSLFNESYGKLQKPNELYDRVSLDPKTVKIANLLHLNLEYPILERTNYISNKIHIFYDSNNTVAMEYMKYYIDFEYDPAIPQFYSIENINLKKQISQKMNEYQGIHNFYKEFDINDKTQVCQFLEDFHKKAKLFDFNYEGIDFFYGAKSLSSDASKNYNQQKKQKSIEYQEQQHLQTLWFYVAIGLNLLQHEGSMILKLYSCNLVKTVSILYILSKCFQKIQFAKLFTSSQVSNEMFILCKSLNKDESVINLSEQLLENYDKLNQELIIPYRYQIFISDFTFEKFMNKFSSDVRFSNLKFYEWLQDNIDDEQAIQNYLHSNFYKNICKNITKFQLPSYEILGLIKEDEEEEEEKNQKEENGENSKRKQNREDVSDSDEMSDEDSSNNPYKSSQGGFGGLAELLGQKDQIKHMEDEKKKREKQQKLRQKKKEKQEEALKKLQQQGEIKNTKNDTEYKKQEVSLGQQALNRDVIPIRQNCRSTMDYFTQGFDQTNNRNGHRDNRQKNYHQNRSSNYNGNYKQNSYQEQQQKYQKKQQQQQPEQKMSALDILLKQKK